MAYLDLRHHLEVLEAKGKLLRITREINKDTELMPLMRWQFRGLEEKDRKAVLFENVIDAKGKRYTIPVAAGTHASSKEIYALAMECGPEEILEKWARVLRQPIAPVIVKEGPVHDQVYMAKEMGEEGTGLDKLPIPISTPGYDPAPFISSGCWISKDPDTGVANVGVYRGQIKGRTRTGISFTSVKHIGHHWEKAKAAGKDLAAAVVIGGPPALGLVGVTAVPYGLDEYGVAGAIAGEPLPLVKCKTVDVEVPATAEIVLEGFISTRCLEPEAPFGEWTGYMGSRHVSGVFEVTCITHRRDPIYHTFVSQFPPSEGTMIRKTGVEGNLYKFLKHDCNIPGLLEVAFHEQSGAYAWLAIKLKKTNLTQPWQALNCAAGFLPNLGKIIIAVDDDIDPKDPDSVIWALAFRMQPHRDLRVTMGKAMDLDPSAAPLGFEGQPQLGAGLRETSCLLIDATRKWPYPPTSLPKKEFMEKAKQIWEELGLLPLKPKVPWSGYSLGLWSLENEEEAELALKGEHYTTGEKLAKRRQEV